MTGNSKPTLTGRHYHQLAGFWNWSVRVCLNWTGQDVDVGGKGTGRARAFQSLVGGGVEPLKAMTLAGLLDAE